MGSHGVGAILGNGQEGLSEGWHFSWYFTNKKILLSYFLRRLGLKRIWGGKTVNRKVLR